MLQKSNNQLNAIVLILILFICHTVEAQVSDSLLYKKMNYVSVGYLRSYYSFGDMYIREVPQPKPNQIVLDTSVIVSKLNGLKIESGFIHSFHEKFGFKFGFRYIFQHYTFEHIKPINPNLIRSITTWHFVSPGLSVLYQYHGIAFEAGFRANVVAKNRRVRIFKENESIEKNRVSYSFFQYEFATHIPLIRKENHRTFLSLSVICDADIFKDRSGYSVFYAASIKTEIPKLRHWKK
ncbi:MAG: hypothetical protein ACK4GL_06770 [Flavobacteriales bacterium]